MAVVSVWGIKSDVGPERTQEPVASPGLRVNMAAWQRSLWAALLRTEHSAAQLVAFSTSTVPMTLLEMNDLPQRTPYSYRWSPTMNWGFSVSAAGQSGTGRPITTGTMGLEALEGVTVGGTEPLEMSVTDGALVPDAIGSVEFRLPMGGLPPLGADNTAVGPVLEPLAMGPVGNAETGDDPGPAVWFWPIL